MLKHFETLVRRVPENKEKLAGIRERIKMIQATMAERAKAQAATA
jgi:DNA-binding XRE family transcriptional regulator